GGRVAAGNVRVAPEGRDAVGAVAGLDVDLGFVDEDHAAGAAGTTETRRLVLVCRSYFTMPSTRANSVKSRPMPTFWPGWMTVPSCRTRMLPARTSSPPERLTPRRWPAESRPLRDEPCPFL